MFALALTVLIPRTVFGDLFLFDIEASGMDGFTDSDENAEETNSKICVWQSGGDMHCVNGLDREYNSQYAQIDIPDRTLTKEDPFYVYTYGNDAMWIDRFQVWRENETGSKTHDVAWRLYWGSSNDYGWCLSTDRNDHLDWNHDDLPQYVPDNQCYYMLRLDIDGSVYGWTSDATLLCRTTKTMGCKKSCESGWTHVDTTDHGCCSSFFSCGGNMKVCEADTECRRRTEVEEDVETIGFIPTFNEEDGHWVQLESPRADLASKSSDGLADRLSEAELAPVSESTDLEEMLPAEVSEGQ